MFFLFIIYRHYSVKQDYGLNNVWLHNSEFVQSVSSKDFIKHTQRQNI